MERKRNRTIIKTLALGLVIAVLSYLFHPEVGQLSVMYNGRAVAEPLVRFAAIPTFLVIMGLAGLLTFVLFLGVGVFIFMGTLFMALMLSFVIAPYFWPVLAIIVLIVSLMFIDRSR